MKINKILMFWLVFFLIMAFAFGRTIIPQGDYDFKGIFGINNATTINASFFHGNGTTLTDVCLQNGTNCLFNTSTQMFQAIDNGTFSRHINIEDNITSLSIILSAGILGNVTDIYVGLAGNITDVYAGLAGNVTDIYAGLSGNISDVKQWISTNDTQKDTSGVYLSNDTITIFFNSSLLNITIGKVMSNSTINRSIDLGEYLKNGTDISPNNIFFSLNNTFDIGSNISWAKNIYGFNLTIQNIFDNPRNLSSWLKLSGCSISTTTTTVDSAGLITCSSISITESQINDLSHNINGTDINPFIVNATALRINDVNVCLSDGDNCSFKKGNTSDELAFMLDNDTIIRANNISWITAHQGYGLNDTSESGGDVTGIFKLLQIVADAINDNELNYSVVTLADFTNDGEYVKNKTDFLANSIFFELNNTYDIGTNISWAKNIYGFNLTIQNIFDDPISLGAWLDLKDCSTSATPTSVGSNGTITCSSIVITESQISIRRASFRPCTNSSLFW